MKRSVQASLCQAYFGPLTMADLVRATKLSQRTIETFWQAAKKDRRIADVPRPHFAKNIVGLADEYDDGDQFDFSPARNERASEELLAALRREHGDDVLRSFDDMPAATLQMEANGFPPSEARLRRFASTKDIYTRALRAKHCTRGPHGERQ